jgi:HSP20 family molecular chaperone IbpA
MSAKWKPSNKNRKWLNLNDLANPSDKKTAKNQTSRTKSFSTNSNYRTAKSYSKRNHQEPKPLIDIFQDNSNITVVAEIAGFNKDTLKIAVQNQKLTLSAKSKDRRYYKSLNLPKVVIPDAMHTKYKNGVLEIKLKKAEAESHAP